MSGICVTPEILDRIKRIDIRKYLADKYGTRFYGSSALCPHPGHDDRNPSFSVWQKDGYYYWCCHACHVGKKNLDGGTRDKNYGNDIIALARWLSDFEGSPHVLSFGEAAKAVCDYAGIAPQERFPAYPARFREQANINAFKAACYHKNLVSDPGSEASRYLASRGLGEEDLEKWNIGFDGRRITFPLLDRQGRVLGFSNRIIGNNKEEGRAKYRNSPNSGIFEKKKYLYGIHNVEPSPSRVFVAEGQMDVIMADKYGLRNVVASLGTAFSEDHARMLKDDFGAEEIVFVFDGDEAGRKGLERAAKIAREYGFVASFAELPDGMDLCDFALESKEDLAEEIRKRACCYFFSEFKEIAEEYDKSLFRISGEVMKKACEIRNRMNSEAEKEMLISYIATRFGISLERCDNIAKRFKGNPRQADAG